MISEEKIKEILDATDIVDLVSNYVSLTKKGSNYFGCCPFHDEKTASFSVSPQKKIAVCMGCHKGGDAINFLKLVKNISFQDAAIELAKKYNIDVDVEIKDKKPLENANLYKASDYASKYYQYYLNNSKTGVNALNYLHNRGLSEDTISAFKIGLSPNSFDTFYKTAKEDGFIELDLLQAGLIKSVKDIYYDLFQNRVMFPISDEFDRVIGFSGRIFYEDKDQPKYVNSPENVIFKKGTVLYNLNNAIPSIRKNDRVILMEGFMDVISTYNNGIKEVVCSMGTALTIDQAKLLKKYTNNVIICYDGDNAGFEAIKKAINVLTEIKLNVNVIALPENLDPDEYIKKYGIEAFKLSLENVLSVLDYNYLYILRGKDLSNISHVEYIKNSVFKLIKQANSETLKERYLNRLSYDIDTSYEGLINDYNSYYKSINNKKIVETTVKPINNLNKDKEKYINSEKLLVLYMIKNKKLFDEIYERHTSYSFFDKRLISIPTKLKKYYDEEYMDFVDLNKFNNYLDEDEKAYILEIIEYFPATIDCNYSVAIKAIEDCFKNLDEYNYTYLDEKKLRKSLLEVDNDETKIEIWNKLKELKKRQIRKK